MEFENDNFLRDALRVTTTKTVDLDFAQVRFTPSGETNEDGATVPAFDVAVAGQAVGTLLFDVAKDAWYRLEPRKLKSGEVTMDLERKGSAPKLKTAAKKLVKARYPELWNQVQAAG